MREEEIQIENDGDEHEDFEDLELVENRSEEDREKMREVMQVFLILEKALHYQILEFLFRCPTMLSYDITYMNYSNIFPGDLDIFHYALTCKANDSRVKEFLLKKKSERIHSVSAVSKLRPYNQDIFLIHCVFSELRYLIYGGRKPENNTLQLMEKYDQFVQALDKYEVELKITRDANKYTRALKTAVATIALSHCCSIFFSIAFFCTPPLIFSLAYGAVEIFGLSSSPQATKTSQVAFQIAAYLALSSMAVFPTCSFFTLSCCLMPLLSSAVAVPGLLLKLLFDRKEEKEVINYLSAVRNKKNARKHLQRFFKKEILDKENEEEADETNLYRNNPPAITFSRV